MCEELDNIFCKKDDHQCHLIDFIRSKDVRIKCYKTKEPDHVRTYTMHLQRYQKRKNEKLESQA